MLELTDTSLEETLKEGWRVVTSPIDTPVCQQVEGYFALALENPSQVPDAIRRMEKTSVRILLQREDIYQRAQLALDLRVKRHPFFGKSNALVTGSLFQGWVVASNPALSSFLLARPTEVHSDSGEFDAIKASMGVDLTCEVAFIKNRKVWSQEFGHHCNGIPLFGGSLLSQIQKHS